MRRRLERGKALADYVGRNDKTRAALRLCRAGAGMPAREAVRTRAALIVAVAPAFLQLSCACCRLPSGAGNRQ